MAFDITIKVQKNWNPWNSADEYKLKFIPSNPTQTAVAQVWKDKQEYRLEAQQINWIGLEGLSSKTISSSLLKFDSEFQVIINPDTPSEMTIRFKRVVRWNLLSLQGAQDLALQLNNGLALNQDTSAIISRMIAHFTSDLEPSVSFIEEILSIFRYATDEEKKMVAQKLLFKQLENGQVNWTGRTIRIVLNFLQVRNNHTNWEQCLKSTSSHSSTPSPTAPLFRAEECVKLLELATKKNEEKKTLPPLLLRAMIVFLDMLQASTLKELYSDDYDKYYEYIKEQQKKIATPFKNIRFDSKLDIQRTFYFEYATRLLRKNPTHDTEKNHIIQKWLRYVRQLKHSKQNLNALRAWQLLNDDLRAGFSFENRKFFWGNKEYKFDEEGHELWMSHLVLLEECFSHDAQENRDDFHAFQLDVTQNNNNLSKALPYKHRFFVQGLIELLKIIIDTHPSSGAMAQDAKAILEKIKIANQIPNPPLPFKLKGKYSNELVQGIEESMKQAIEPPQVSTDAPDSLFKRALAEHIPWIAGLSRIKDRLSKIKEIQRLPFVSLKIKSDQEEESSFLNRDLLKTLKRCIKNKDNKVILIKGIKGCGKSALLRSLADQYLDCYQSKNDPIAFYIRFSDLNNPRQGLIDEVLESYHLFSLKYELQAIPTLWLLDEVSPLTFNPYQTNAFKTWPQAQLIMSCHSSSLPQNYRQYLDPFSLIRVAEIERDVFYKELEVAPLADEEIKETLFKYKEKNPNANKNLTLEEYLYYIEIWQLSKEARNLAHLGLIAEKLPEFVAKQRSDIITIKREMFKDLEN